MRNSTVLVYFFLIYSLSSCKNDLVVNAPWRETAVIWGLLDQNDTTHYIRVQKVYQNTGSDAIRIANQTDSLYYDTLLVELEAYDGRGALIWKKPLLEDLTINKDSGSFAGTPHQLYSLKQYLNINFAYKLSVKNPTSKKEYTSTTGLVGPAYILNIPPSFQLIPLKHFSLVAVPSSSAKAYDLNLNLYISQIDSITGDSISQVLTWYAIQAQEPDDPARIELRINGRPLYDFLSLNFTRKPNHYVKLRKIGVNVVGGGTELLNYININRPSLGIVQKNPEYTNIANGLGLFSSRNNTRVELPVRDSMNYYLSEDEATKHLGFRYK